MRDRFSASLRKRVEKTDWSRLSVDYHLMLMVVVMILSLAHLILAWLSFDHRYESHWFSFLHLALPAGTSHTDHDQTFFVLMIIPPLLKWWHNMCSVFYLSSTVTIKMSWMYRIWFQFKRRIAWEKSHELKKNQAKLLFSRGNIVKKKDIQDIPMEKIFKKKDNLGKVTWKKESGKALICGRTTILHRIMSEGTMIIMNKIFIS